MLDASCAEQCSGAWTVVSEDWLGKTCVVTGAASGIGAATARQLKAHGAQVIALDRTAPGGDCADLFIEFDQGDPSSIERACDKIELSVDALLNIAGVPPTKNIEPAELLFINFFGLRFLTEKLAPRIRAGGAVVNMSSHAGWRWRENARRLAHFLNLRRKQEIAQAVSDIGVVTDGLGDLSAYPLSKQLINLWTTQSPLSDGFGGLRMNAISCAGVATPILDDFLASFGEESSARIRSIGLACPEDIAPTLVFVASPAARWIRGAVIPVDGGASAVGFTKALGL